MIKFKWETEFKETEIGEIRGSGRKKELKNFISLCMG